MLNRGMGINPGVKATFDTPLKPQVQTKSASKEQDKSDSSPRAAASILFSCLALFLWRVYGEVHLVAQKRLALSLKEQISSADQELVLACIVVAGLGAIWCSWSWLRESRLAAAVATLFTLIAVVMVSVM